MVLVNEILHNVNQYMRGVPVTDETLAIDLIDRVGPGGHYLQEAHTMEHFREVRYSKLFEMRMSSKSWIACKRTGNNQDPSRWELVCLQKSMSKPVDPRESCLHSLSCQGVFRSPFLDSPMRTLRLCLKRSGIYRIMRFE
jgi:trimethylamine--corrinoid protein Co-methyltransferase